MYREFFAFRGYRMVTAGSGLEALEIARGRERPALILMDLQMRGLSGTDAMLELRRDEHFADVPIVAFTAHALQGEHDEAMRAGFDAVIPKPCFPDKLIELVQPFLLKQQD